MSIRATALAAVCVATLVTSQSVSAQDTTHTRDHQMQTQRIQMTTQARDSIIRQLTDSANRLQNQMQAQQLRDSVAVLRRLDLTTDTMSGRLGTPLTQQQQTQQNMQNQQQTSQQRYDQQQRATSDQRMRVQKDGRSWDDTSRDNR